MNNLLDIKKMIEVATFDIIYQLPKNELGSQPSHEKAKSKKPKYGGTKS